MFITVKTKYVCGIDLHARTMSVCVFDKNGKILFKKSIKCDIGLLMSVLKPYLKSVTVGVESTFNCHAVL